MEFFILISSQLNVKGKFLSLKRLTINLMSTGTRYVHGQIDC